MYTQDSERGGLLRKNAQEIALSIASAINCDVLITDIQGIVAGTSAASRLGTLHEPALQVIHRDSPWKPARKTRVPSRAARRE